MTPDDHQRRHQMLHRYLDELVADYFRNTGKLFTQSTIMELMEWSHQQTISPEEPKSGRNHNP